jgi:putative phosphonate metabolism protein
MRYAVYFTPAADTALWRFGSSVLGYDAAARETVAFPEHGLWRQPWFARLQETPARYGFHATLKPPFALAPGVTEIELLDRAAAFGARSAPVYLPALEVALLGDFVALRPLAEDAELNRLAAACVQDFDDLRAPLGEDDRARRVSQALTPRQHAHLYRWGYPYVFEDFRFHMTLTGAIPKPLQPRALETLKVLYRRARAPVCVDTVSVLVQPTQESRFGLIERFPLRDATPVISLDR